MYRVQLIGVMPGSFSFFADLTGLPPIHIQVGSKEILLDDASRFKRKSGTGGCRGRI